MMYSATLLCIFVEYVCRVLYHFILLLVWYFIIILNLIAIYFTPNAEMFSALFVIKIIFA